MGNMYSTKRNDVLRKNKNVNTQSRRKFLPVTSEAGDNSGNSQVVTLPEFTDKQKELVIESWTILKKDIDQVGLALFMKLFASNPDVQGVFSPFKGLSQEELSQSNQLRSHAMRVTGDRRQVPQLF
ncbi:hypothetical protein DPMN_027913 [Dreissena polymorpha]|uniref:Globin domain-containing protein n=1 Tax=Dreissena polymorpha TaxID=45954 RepID=A0A9D4LW78_DREPO|nr:hypothetical protein DPMN_027913 [Dreissena polymorpha]